jgi:hypothetical protein
MVYPLPYKTPLLVGIQPHSYCYSYSRQLRLVCRVSYLVPHTPLTLFAFLCAPYSYLGFFRRDDATKCATISSRLAKYLNHLFSKTAI